ncbi:MAG: O-antigen ligase family protein [Aequorivita antarctica]
MSEGFKNLQKQLPFLIFPLIFFSIDITARTKQIILKYFSYGVIISALFAIFKAGYFKINNFGDYFYYDKFGLLLEIHTTYFAMYVVIAISYFTNCVLKSAWTRSLKEISAILFLLGVLYILSVRMSIIALCISILILVIGNRAILKPKSIIFFICSIFIILFSYFSPNFQKRFNVETPEGLEISDIDARSKQWSSVLQVIEKNNLLFGAGTGDGHATLYNQYFENGFETGYIYQYNAHNQFLETTLYYGLLGLVLLMTIIFIVIKNCYLRKNYLAVSIIIIQIIFMITESTLESQSGIVLFAYFTAMLASYSILEKDGIV